MSAPRGNRVGAGGRWPGGVVVERGVSRLALGRQSGEAFVYNAFAGVETAPLPGFAPETAFAF